MDKYGALNAMQSLRSKTEKILSKVNLFLLTVHLK